MATSDNTDGTNREPGEHMPWLTVEISDEYFWTRHSGGAASPPDSLHQASLPDTLAALVWQAAGLLAEGSELSPRELVAMTAAILDGESAAHE